MSDQSKFAIPHTVERFLSDYASTSIDGTDRLNAKRLLDAPCSRQAFWSISNRLEKADGCRYDLDHQLRFVADIAMIAGGVPYQHIRITASDLPGLLRVAADAARTLSEAVEYISMGQRESGLQNDYLLKLFNIEWFPYGLHDFANLAEIASEHSFETPYQEFLIEVKTRQFNQLAAYVHTVDWRIAELVEIDHLPVTFKLSNTEMAGLAWAVLGRDDISPFAQRHDAKDSRAELVRKARGKNKLNSYSFF